MKKLNTRKTRPLVRSIGFAAAAAFSFQSAHAELPQFTPAKLAQAVQASMKAGEKSIDNIIYTPLQAGEVPVDVAHPRSVTIDSDGNVVEYQLSRPQVFDYGVEGNGFILDDFRDNDHQNNVGGAKATMHCENYTEGGGYWYVFAGDNSTIENQDGLPINAYNIIEAVQDKYMYVEMKAGAGDNGYAGIGTNIVFEEYSVALDKLESVKLRLKGSGKVVPMFEPSPEDKKGDWGNYAADPIRLTSSWKEYTIDAEDFVGEQWSPMDGISLLDMGQATKFFFQIKDGASVDLYIDSIELVGDGLSIEDIEYKNHDVDSVEECGFIADLKSGDVVLGVPKPYDPTEPYMVWPAPEVPTVVPPTPEDTPTANGSTGKGNWLRAEGTRLYDSNGKQVRLTGVNWFGFETRAQIPMGIWDEDDGGRTYMSMLDQIKELGFNTVRIPFSDEVMYRSWGLHGFDKQTFATPKTFAIDLAANGLSKRDTPVDLMVAIADYAQEIGLKIILDSHSRRSDGYLTEGHWNAVDFPADENDWIDMWVKIADMFKDNDAVVAFDLNNEPHFEAAWDSTNPDNNWNEMAERLANAIQEVNPNALILVEGVESLNEDSLGPDSYWWGGNLKGVKTAPITLTHQNKLVYSPHVYGPEVFEQPWFKDPVFPANLEYIWQDRFGFVNSENIGHMLIGEFGIKNDVPGSASNQWFESFIKYLSDRKDGYSFTYWAWNPNSGDTGGILQNDWNSVNEWKMDYLTGQRGDGVNLLAPLIGNQNGSFPEVPITVAPSDADNDGIIDSQDNCKMVANPTQLDSDDDGLGNVCDDTPFGESTDDDNDGILNDEDNCPNIANPTQLDSDDDGLGNACDETPFGQDADGDGIVDTVDNCPAVANAGQFDQDGDNIGNACDDDIDGDGCANILEPGNHWNASVNGCSNPLVDSDNDGIVDDVDNCPNVANPGQWDNDLDGMGNKCDADVDGDSCPNVDEPNSQWDPLVNGCNNNNDTDKDGVLNAVDNCPTIANPGQWDRDQDGQGNECDADLDGDTCPNVDELGSEWNPNVNGCQSIEDDVDGDSILNDADNCPTTFNPGQWDKDNDGQGNECDADLDGDSCPNVDEPGFEWNSNVNGCGDIGPDMDKDGITDNQDNCPTIANPGQWDKDQDGEGNDCDFDIDGDGFSNVVEIAAGTKVWDPKSHP